MPVVMPSEDFQPTAMQQDMLRDHKRHVYVSSVLNAGFYAADYAVARQLREAHNPLDYRHGPWADLLGLVDRVLSLPAQFEHPAGRTRQSLGYRHTLSSLHSALAMEQDLFVTFEEDGGYADQDDD